MPLFVEAATREEALAKLRAALQDRLRNGAEIVPLETTTPPHPLAKFVGMFKDDPWIEDMNPQIHPKDMARKTRLERLPSR